MAAAPRVSRMEKQRAMHIARNCKDSKFGTTLLEDNVKEHRLLEKQLQKLENERRRLNFHVAQVKNMFLHERNNKQEPMVIVERAPSPDILRRIVMIENDIEDTEVPGYMKPLKTRVKTPSNLLTIDAFSVKTRKKANVWEDALKESHEPRFQSAVIPSCPLTMPELYELQRGWKMHRPSSHPANKTKVRREPARAADDNQIDNSNTFITQLPMHAGNTGALTGKTRQLKTVHFETNRVDKCKSKPFAGKAFTGEAPIHINRDFEKSKNKDKRDEFKESLKIWLKKTEGLL